MFNAISLYVYTELFVTQRSRHMLSSLYQCVWHLTEQKYVRLDM